MLLAAGTGVWLSALTEDRYLAQATLLATVFACLALVGGLVLRQPAAVPFAVVVLSLPYVAFLAFEAGALDASAPVVAALLYSLSELAYWSLELRGLTHEPGTHLRRIALLAGLVLATVALGTGVLAVVEVVTARGAAVDVLGAVAAVGAIALLALAAARRTVP